jgi:sialic acid synthase SpsE
MGDYIEINGRRIGEGQTPFVMAEVGINHEGDIKKAIELVDAAVQAEADCIKFQCHITEAEMVKTNMRPGKISDERLWDIIKRCELTYNEEVELKKYCDSKGIMFLSTPFSREAADRLEEMGVAAYKIGSGECNNIPLIKHIAKKGKPIILSTGMNDMDSISRSVMAIRDFKVPFMLMHCTSMYPTPYDRVRLGAIRQLREEFSVPIGLSDHSFGIYTCLGAVALGASMLEKHFTITHDWPGPDIAVSIDPEELSDLVKGSRAIFAAGGGMKNILPEEKPVIDFAYASVCTIKPVKKGDEFTRENIWVKRPGIGEIHAEEYEDIIGKKCNSNLAEGVLLKKSNVDQERS